MQNIKNFKDYLNSFQDCQMNESIESIELNEMAKVGYLDPKNPTIIVFVNTNDNGNIPHFHVWKLLKGRKII